jgi:hypothetical protein
MILNDDWCEDDYRIDRMSDPQLPAASKLDELIGKPYDGICRTGFDLCAGRHYHSETDTESRVAHLSIDDVYAGLCGDPMDDYRPLHDCPPGTKICRKCIRKLRKQAELVLELCDQMENYAKE